MIVLPTVAPVARTTLFKFFHKSDNVVVRVGGFTYGKGTAISSAFPLKIQCVLLPGQRLQDGGAGGGGS